MKISIKYKEQQKQVIIQSNEKTVFDLKKEVKTITNIPVIQQQLSTIFNDKKNVLSDDRMPIKLAFKPGQVIHVKNLGPQVLWRHVFYVEYFGPIFIMPLFYFLGKRQSYTDVQCLALIMGILHYVKRELQTAYVHVFSRPSMPKRRLLLNCIHYWVFFAIFNSVELYLFPKGHTYQPTVLATIFAVWLVFELFNLKCHLILSSFRQSKQKSQSSGYENITKKKGIPYGWGFGLVSCANYFWEMLGWMAFSVLTQNWTAYFFTIISAYQMLDWALKKHKGYKEQFGDKYPKNRKAMIPFII